MSARVFIASAVRTPIGSFNGSLAKLPAPKLGAAALRAAVERAAGTRPADVEDVLMGNVLSAGVGQAPARQAAIHAGLAEHTEATTINKVCSSGLKAVTLAAQAIMLGQRHVVAAGGMESMSLAPYYFPRNAKANHIVARDGMVHDGLWDAYGNYHMGEIAEKCADERGITREQMDAYAVASYTRAKAATSSGRFKNELVAVGDVVADEEYTMRGDTSRFASLRPAFRKTDGRVTAANASKISDGAAALVLCSKQSGAIAEILGFADAALAPDQFPVAPAAAIPLALARASVSVRDISLWEINEAFAAVAIANLQILKLDPESVNVCGGAVALGHPIGASGARILVTLIHQLEAGQLGCAAICNGGGGSTAVVVKRL